MEEVARWRLCLGCGACAYGCPNQAVELMNLTKHGIRPRINSEQCEKCGTCLQYCPGIDLTRVEKQPGCMENLWNEWGSILSMWEGYAADPEIRYLGSSGGTATALSLFCLEQEGAAGVFHIRENPDRPLENESVISTDRADLVKATGSRYCPAALCGGLKQLEEAPGACVVVGKPCDIEALTKACEVSPALKEKVFLKVSIFCAGTPSMEGTLDVLAALGVGEDQVQSLRYRGCGWPGMMRALCKDGKEGGAMTYAEAWGGYLSKRGPLRCRLCPDPTGEYADISCGDPWYQVPDGVDPGRSLVLARTARGEEILKKALGKEYVVAVPSEKEDVLYLSQKSLHGRLCHTWGRLAALKSLCIPVPEYRGFRLFQLWRSISLKEKFKSLAGTWRRAIQRKYYLPQDDLYPPASSKEEPSLCRH